MQVYLTDQRSIAFYEKQASPEFWDTQWATSDLKKRIESYARDRYFIPLVKKYLPKGSKVLDGGCGIGGLVYALQLNGYDAIGVDFAENTVRKSRELMPQLNLSLNDVRQLPFKDNELDGYISAGVIEHFWEGYEKVLTEISRTLKKGGYLFISFPYMSPLRKLKTFLHLYKFSSTSALNTGKDTFYQFALEHKTVLQKLKQNGFYLIHKQPIDGLKGLKDESPYPLKQLLQVIYNGRNIFTKALRYLFDKILTLFTAHGILMVMKKY